jgi:uncharacterized protein
MKERYLEVPFETKEVSETGIFKGYASVFGGKPDSHGDIIAHGAFSKSVLNGGRNGTGIAMLWQHNSDQPIGVYPDIHEDGKGLKVEGQIAVETSLGHDAHVLMKMGAIKGLSIGWDFPRDKNGRALEESFEIDEKKRTRTLKQIELWEISPVTFPAQVRARITGVKTLEGAENERELERALRDMGLSQKQSEFLVSLCKPGLREVGKTHKDSKQEILESIDQTVAEIASVKGDADLKSVLRMLENTKNDLSNFTKGV